MVGVEAPLAQLRQRSFSVMWRWGGGDALSAEPGYTGYALVTIVMTMVNERQLGG